MFVPCTTLGRGYFDIYASNDVPGFFFYGCDSPSAPRLLQSIIQTPTDATATSYTQEAIARFLDPHSLDNQNQGVAPWFEIPSLGPAGSRTFKRFGLAQDTTGQIQVRMTKGRYAIGVLLSFHDAAGELLVDGAMS